MKTLAVHYFGQTVELPDLPEYQKFYRKLEADQWEPDTFRALRENLDQDTVYIDIGAWIGVTPFWASSYAKRVIAVEPDPRCRSLLAELATAYPNVTVIDCALSPERSVTLHAIDGFGSSETTALDIAQGQTVTVPCLSAEALMDRARDEQIFVKIDIEGYEYCIPQEIAKFANARLRGLQCAIHPQLYEQTLHGNKLFRRLKTLLSTMNMSRLSRDLSAAPPATKYATMLSYLLFGILTRRTPKGTDFIFTPIQRP